jgi:uncharacterized protein
MSQRIAITGATGLIGGKLAHRLLREGDSLVLLSRDPQAAQRKLGLPADYLKWNGNPGVLQGIGDIDAVVNLAGEPVADSRWSEKQKRRIIDSRVLGTRAIAEEIRQLSKTQPGSAPRTWLSASAIGYYGDTGDRVLTERAEPGSDFLAHVCSAWEMESLGGPAPSPKLRRVAFRIGIVLSNEGGALAKLTPLFRAGLGGPIGRGHRWMSWIHINDLVTAIVHALRTPSLEGPVNAVAPHPVPNREFTRSLAEALHRPALLPVPPALLRIALGEMSEALLGSQRVSADKLLASGFQFAYPQIAGAFENLFG